ncbi:MAG TPA: class I SAM-dependent methyltransferase [Acidimicrobiales bacterium]|nr:class I SAM-dependent methyltransferase [Acidimicrobiales bacterium]
MIRHLDRVVPAPVGPRPELAGPDHPMRKVTRQVAFEPGGWTPERAARVTEVFDGLASVWDTTRADQPRIAPLADAVERGGPTARGCWVEVGSGSGLATPWLATQCRTLLAVDLSPAMLAQAPPDAGFRVRADAARLPLADATVDAAVLVNALLFPAEIARVVRPGGALVWFSSLGDATPIYLAAEDVDEAFGGRWDGVAADAAWGTWAVLHRPQR